ncbi:MAG: hypothetical protein RIS35_2407 [Pseudomonadota bacterium]
MKIDKRLADEAPRWGVQFGTSGARGPVERMTDAVCHAYATAFLRAVAGAPARVVIGHDLRPSSPAIAAACACAVVDAGARVVFVGALPTPAIAHHATRIGAPAIVVTGSHIPFDRNGIKFYRTDGEIDKDDEQAMLAQPVPPGPVDPAVLPPVDPSARHAWLDRYLDFFGPDALDGMRVAVYEHSSVARDLLPEILRALGAEVLSLGRTDDFVPIDTEAVRPEDVEQARRWAREHRFDALVSTDGDADRPLIGDENGRWLRGDVVGILCARWLGAEVVATPVSSNTALEKCGLFRQVIRTRIGSPYVIAAMACAARADHGPAGRPVVGYEANGGFLLGTDLLRDGRRLSALPTRDAVLPILALLRDSRQRGCRLSELPRDLPPRFTHSDRLQDFPTQRARDLLARLSDDPALAARRMAPGAGAVDAIDHTDGLRMTFESGDIVHLRPSGNAPELRCYAESDDEERATALCDDCLGRIASAPSGPSESR